MCAFRFVVPLLVAFAVPAATSAQEGSTKPPAKVEGQDKEAPKETWAVVKVGDQMKAMKASEVEATKKKNEADHKAAMAKYEEAKKAAEANKTKFDQPAPVAQVLTVLAKDFKSADEADAQLKKLKAEEDARKKAEEDAKKKKAEEVEKKKGDGN
jgi:colicin import membrane protein